jgi:hypothetical protein
MTTPTPTLTDELATARAALVRAATHDGPAATVAAAMLAGLDALLANVCVHDLRLWFRMPTIDRRSVVITCPRCGRSWRAPARSA